MWIKSCLRLDLTANLAMWIKILYWDYNSALLLKLLTIKLLGELIMKKVSKETKREQRYNASLHNLFVKAQKEINANE